MSSVKLRKEFLNFFEKKGHKIVPSSSLMPADQSVLFTTAGMQQFKPYYLGEKSPYGKNICSCQKCFRTSDIEEVGDDSHLTFLEMLGNFSFDGYFKTDAIKLAYEFLFKELKLPLESAIFTVFEGDPSTGSEQSVPADEESLLIWKKLGIPESQIKKCGREDNFWGPTGEEGPCGPTTEIHLKGLEVWNLVFNEYYQDKDKKLTPLKQKGVDTGMGLERLAMICQGKNSVYETDLFSSIIKEIQNTRYKIQDTKLSERSERIIADHIKGSVFLISEGIFPSNVERGYVLRRILRRAIRYGKTLRLPKNFLIPLTQKAVEIYKDIYPELESKETDILTVIQKEEEDFEKSAPSREKTAIKLMDERQRGGQITGTVVYDIFGTTSVAVDRIEELAREHEIEIIKPEEFNKRAEEFKEISRAGAKSKFGGVGKEATLEAAKLHTATHLLQAALREVLGEHVRQMGSDITSQRLRFDFVHSQKMAEEEIKETEILVNQKVKEDLEVKKAEMKYEDALKAGALAFFKDKYPERVTVYSIDNFSKEICVGPHVKRTSDLGSFKIIKEESSGAGIRRIRAILE